MLALQISINGRRVLTAGTEHWRALTANLGAERLDEQDTGRLSLSAFVVRKAGNEYASEGWTPLALAPGDKVTIDIVETASPDLPDASGPAGRIGDF